MNQPNRAELFIVPPEEKKLIILEDPKLPSAATITINRQDHTLANLLRSELLNNPRVTFAGYRVPHPLHPQVELRIQTDGSEAPAKVLRQAATDLLGQLDVLEKMFESEFRRAAVEATAAGEEDVGMGGVGEGRGEGDYFLGY